MDIFIAIPFFCTENFSENMQSSLRLFGRATTLLFLLGLTLGTAAADSFGKRVAALATEDFDQLELAIDKVAATGHARAGPVLNALLNGELYIWPQNKGPVIAREGGGAIRLFDAATGQLVGEVADEDELESIYVTNTLRIQIQELMAQLTMADPDPQRRRFAAVQTIGADIDEGLAGLLRQRLRKEDDAEVRDALAIALATYRLDADDAQTRLAAISRLRGSLYPEVLNRLTDVAQSDDDDAVRSKARAAIKSIKARVNRYYLLENVFFGLSLGSVLLLAAVGLAITFGVMGVINMAHGELMMIGAYTTYLVQKLLPGELAWSIPIAIPAAFVVSGLVGIAIERGVIRFLYGRPLETLLATFGISLILQQAVRSIFSPLNLAIGSPGWMRGSLEINPVFSLTHNRLYILLFSIAVFLSLLMVLKRTPLGLKVRAVAQNRAMARTMGVRADRVDALTFGLGAGIAGVAGVALSQLTNVGPNLGQNYIIDSFMVVVFGGVGNLWGMLVGAFGLGVANKFLEPYAGAVLAKILVLVLIIAFIQVRPRGLFPQRGRAAEN